MTEPASNAQLGGPSVVGDLLAVIAGTETNSAGVGWRLSESGRQLDANVVHLGPERRVDMHIETDLDVFLVVVSGVGTLFTGETKVALTTGSLVWLPHGTARSLAAGDQGLDYLTVHRRRPGMRIGHRPPDALPPS